MLSPLATPTVVSGAESLSACQIPPGQLQRSWFGVTPAMPKSVVLTGFDIAARGELGQILGCSYKSSRKFAGGAQIGAEVEANDKHTVFLITLRR